MNKSTQESKKGFLFKRNFNQLVFVAVPAAFGHELRSFIEGRVWVGQQDGQFFCQAQLAVHCATAVRFSFANDRPFYDRNVTLTFESPNKLCLVSLGRTFKALLMVVVTSFKNRLTTAII